MRNGILACGCALLVLAAAAGPLPAQRAGWDIRAELSASLFFGNTNQTLLTTRNSVAHRDSSFELKGDVRFTYGESEVDERSVVNRRSWQATVSFDHRPYGRVSPFALGTFETSLERRIEARYSAGFGSKLVLVQNDRTQANLSAAMLAEQTRFPEPAPAHVRTDLVRWSGRMRLQHQANEKVLLTHETFYRPEVALPSRFTLTTSSSAAYKLGRMVSTTLSLLANHDSEARERGARSNSDGQIVFGILTTF